MTILVPRRARLAEALACVTGQSAAWWSQPYIARSLLHFSDRAIAFAPAGTYRLGGWGRADPSDVRLTITDPREAWETLCTALDLHGWVDDPRRRFVDAVAGPVSYTVGWDSKADCPRLYASAPLRSGGRLTVDRLAPEDGPYRPGESAAARRQAREEAATREIAAQPPILLPHPATVADAVAFAADAPGVLAAEAIARELAGVDLVEWRVEPAAASIWTTGRKGRGVTPQRAERLRVCDALAPLGYACNAITLDALVLVAPAL